MSETGGTSESHEATSPFVRDAVADRIAVLVVLIAGVLAAAKFATGDTVVAVIAQVLA